MPRFIKRKNPLKTFKPHRPYGKAKKKQTKAAPLPEALEAKPQSTTLPTHLSHLSPETREINQLMDDAIDRISGKTEMRDNQIPSFTPNPASYNGISNEHEEFKILHHEISTEQRKAQELEERLKIIQLDYEQEKSKLTDTINELKRELHRTKPLHDNALFSLTRELRSTIQEMESFKNKNFGEPLPYPPPPPFVPLSPPSRTEVTVAPKTVTKNQNQTLNQVSEPKPEQEAAKEDTTSPKKGKFLTSATVALAILVTVAGLVAYSFLKKPTVDQKLVEEYLNKQNAGIVAGASTEPQTDASKLLPTPPPAQTTMDLKKLEAEIPFEQTIWDTLKDPNFGVKLQYPSNTAELLKTDSNITFLRKDGYIFKIQRIETALTPEEYWKQVKATSLNYKDNKTKYLNRDALFLEIDDVTDYPGNRYLVKEGNFLYDIWYATQSEAFSEDDIRRAKYMLDTVSFESS